MMAMTVSMPRGLRGRLLALAVLAELPVIAYAVHAELSAGESIGGAMRQAQVLTHLTVIALIGLAALGVVWYAADRWILRDVDGVVGAANRLAAGDLSARAPIARVDEIDALASAFNDMASIIEHRAAAHADADVERRKLESQLERAQRLEAVGRLAGGVAHDFNNLITVIFACVDEAMEHPHTNSTTEQLAEIRNAAQRAASLTNQLLAFSRKQVLQPQVLDLNETLTEVDRLLQRLIGDDIDLQTTCDPALPPTLLDPHQVEQVIVNLAVNARDAMPAGGRLTLSTCATSIGAAHVHGGCSIPPGDYARLVIQDTGVGMSPEVRERIFETFFSTKGADGTGLGLATVYGIVKQSEGFIVVDSEPGQGTTFTIYFPATRQTTEANVPAEPPAVVGGNQTILVIEDEASVRSLLVAALRRSGYDVLEAGGAADALEIAGSIEHLDMVLVDLMLPEMGGSALVAEVQKFWPDVLISYMSGHSDAEMIKRRLLNPDDRFLQKPFRLQALTSHVQAVLGGADHLVAHPHQADLCAGAAVA